VVCGEAFGREEVGFIEDRDLGIDGADGLDKMRLEGDSDGHLERLWGGV
jgi:hypothetical protein